MLHRGDFRVELADVFGSRLATSRGSQFHEAKSNLSKLIERGRAGDEVIIAKAGTPIVRLVPVDRPAKRVFGSAKGQIVFKKN
jgi:prevent-host-death family protein